MLKKTLKTVAKLKFRAAEAHRDQLRDGAPLAAKLSRAIADLHKHSRRQSSD